MTRRLRLPARTGSGPMAAARAYAATEVGEPIEFSAPTVSGGRRTAWTEPRVRDVLVGAGFVVTHLERVGCEERVERGHPGVAGGGDGGGDGAVGEHWRGVAVRTLSLPDTVGSRMRLLVCGLNPSIYSAERGVGFARPGNRFWPAVIAAGLVDHPRDTVRALRDHGVGMTDLCKRATVASAELRAEEYVEGAARVERLVRWLRPGAVVFVGLEGWRAAIDPRTTAGVQPAGFGGRPAYVLPSTSGLNAHSRLGDLVDHFRRAAALASSGRRATTA